MDAAQVKTVNTALFMLGQEPVADLSEASLEGSNAARKILRGLDDARDVVLAAHGWVCALTYVTLNPAEIDGYVNFRYPTVFYQPGDALHVWEVEGCRYDRRLGGWGPRWQAGTVETVGGARKIIRAARDHLWADGCVSALEVAYVRRASWSALDTHVADAVAAEAAYRACYSVTGDNARVATLEKKAMAARMEAIGADGTQEGGQPPLAPSIPQRLRDLSR